EFHTAKVEVYDSSWNQVTLAGNFTDPNLPAGYAPFGIQNLNNQIFVAYAMQDAARHDDVSGSGMGYVNVFNMDGQFVKRFASADPLNSPWGFTQAPTPYGPFSGAILIGNFGDGRINAFNPTNGTWLGALKDPSGDPMFVEGLWGIIFGNGTSQGGDSHTLYF